MSLATLGIIVDPTGAEAGLGRVDRGLQQTARNAKATEDAARQAGSGMGSGFSSAGSATEQLNSKMGQLAAGLAVVAGAVASLRGAFDLLNQSVRAASVLEDTTLQLAVLSGSFGKATEQLKLFQSFADRTQFKLGDVSQAGKIIQLFDSGTSSVQDLQKELTKLGDMASVAGRPLNDVAVVYERLKASVREGGQIGDAARSLQEMGILAPAVVISLQNADKFGSSAAEKLRILEAAIGRTSGATDRANKLYSSQASTLEDSWGHVKEALGQPIMESLKPVLVEAADYMSKTLKPAAADVGKTISGWIDTLNGAAMSGGGSKLFDAAAGAAGDALGRLDKQFTTFVTNTVSTVASSLTAALEASSANIDARLKVTFLQFAVDVKEAMAHPLDFIGRNLPNAPGQGNAAEANAIMEEARRADATRRGLSYAAGPTAAPTAPSLTLQERLVIAQTTLANADKTLAEKVDALNRTIGTNASTPGAFSQAYRDAYSGGAGGINALHGVTASSLPDGFQRGSRSYVFGRNMDGSPDMTDASMGANAHLGAYRSTNLLDPSLMGAAIGPDQATALTGIANGFAAQTAMLGRYLEIQLGTQSALVQVVDRAPGGKQGIELTPAGHRAVGDMSGDAAIAYRLLGDQQVGERLKSQYFQGGEVRPAEKISASEQAFTATGALKFTPDSAAVKLFNDTVTQLNYSVENGKIGWQEYRAQYSEAADKLANSAKDWNTLSGRINSAATEQARYNQQSKETQRLIGLNQNGAGSSFAFGLTDAAHRQGTSDQQFAKLGGDVYQQLGQSFTSVADSFIDNNGRIQQSFGQMTAQLLKDIAKLIINMLILKAVQAGVNAIFGGSGASFAGGNGIEATSFNGTAVTYHTGGLVGISANPGRQVPDALFYGAPRLHSGGYLAPGEVPAILQTGEMVLSRSQVQGMASAPRGPGGAGGQVVNISVPIMGGSGGGGRDSAPALTQEDAKALQKQFQEIADARIMRATRYRGTLNPG